jgi:hypothetical protein
MSMNKITAVIDEVKDPETIPFGDGKEFTKQEIVLRIDPQSERAKVNYVPIELSGKSVGAVSASDVGRKGEFGFFINGRKGSGNYADRVFVSLRYAEHTFVDDVQGEPAEEIDDLQF